MVGDYPIKHFYIKVLKGLVIYYINKKMNRNDLKGITVKQLKQEVMKVKRGFQVSKLKRVDVENVILNNQELFNHLLTIDVPKKEKVVKNKKINNKEKEKDYAIVYFGAGWDFKPINNPLYKKINHFIFVDSLPNLSHYEKGQAGYEKSKDKEAFINTLKQYAQNVGFELTDIKNNLLTFTKGGIILEYYINTTVEEALKNHDIRKKINKALWVHVKGFNPYEYGLKVGDLPNTLENRTKLREL
jgi:hypothetical protein